jgi:hypothetical protein
MQADCELACDGLALSVLPPHETAAYGHTVIRMIEALLVSRRQRPVLAAFISDRARMQQRVAMISRFRKDRYQWSGLAVILVASVAGIGLTNGRTSDSPVPGATGASQGVGPIVSLRTSAYSSTKKIYIRHLKLDKYLVADGTTVACASDPGDAGLWEARYDGEFTPNGPMLIYSVSQGKYLSTDSQGRFHVTQDSPDQWARWFRKAGPLGVEVMSQGLAGAYLYLEASQLKLAYAKGVPSRWDIMQLE